MESGLCWRIVLGRAASLALILPASGHAAGGYVMDPVQAFVLETVLADEVRAFHDGRPTYLLPAGTARTRSEAAMLAGLRTEFARFYQGSSKPRKEVAHMAILVSQTVLLLPDRNACSADPVRCRAAISGVRTRDDEASLQTTLRAFQDAGLDLTPLAGPAP